MFGFMKVLMPKEVKFFNYFESHSRHILAASESLCNIVIISRGPSDDISYHVDLISREESKADLITRSTLMDLHTCFITPFDRTDIHALITAMDDTIDLIEEVAQRISIYGVKSFTPEMRDMANTIRDAARMILEVVPLLSSINSNVSNINAKIQKMSEIEEEADKKLRDGLSKLMKEDDTKKFIIRKEIYELLESVIDRCEDVFDTIGGIVIEQV